MTLTLELSGSSDVAPARASHVFGEEGGTIGRAPTNSWVIPHNKVSGLHARISFRNGVFYIEDTSRNGVCVNSSENRLVRNRPYALKSGDRLLIEPYEITTWVADEGVAPGRASGNPFVDEDPFLPSPAAARSSLPSNSMVPEPAVGGEVDPLKFFDPVGEPAPRRRVELPFEDGLGQHYQPPAVLPDPTPGPPQGVPAAPAIPAGYNPLADEPAAEPIAPPPIAPPIRPRPGDSAVIRARRDASVRRPRSAAPLTPALPPDPFEAPPPASAQPPIVPRPAPPVQGPPIPPLPDSPGEGDPLAPALPAPPSMESPFADLLSPPAGRQPAVVEAPRSPAAVAPVPQPPAPEPIAPARESPGAGPPLSAGHSAGGSDLAALLAGAGVPDAVVTPELTHSLGEILKVVVVGLMDVLQSRQRIKEEFRMQQTIFRPSDNNPLKFSVNVEDALHNLLVKRNPAYLGPVDAFADAFDDLRDHQLAMLAGMRVAFEAMLAEFDPDRLQQQFDSQLGRSSLALVPAKLRYWDLYRARRAELVKDPEEAFDRLFGDQFTRAYEEQFRKLKSQRRARASRGAGEIGSDRG